MREEVVDKFATDLNKLQSEIQNLLKVNKEEELNFLNNIDQIKTRDEVKIEEAKETVKAYEKSIVEFKNEISNEVKI